MVEPVGWGFEVEGRSGRQFSVAATRRRSSGVCTERSRPFSNLNLKSRFGVLFAAALPSRVWVAEVERRVERGLYPGVVGEFRAAVPGDRPAQVVREVAHLLEHRGGDSPGAVVPGEMEEDREPGRALHERADRGPVAADDVGAGRSATPGLLLARFSDPPSAPDVQLSSHPALHG